MSSGHQRIKWRRNIAENFNPLNRVHERYRQTTDRRQTDGRTTTYSEHEHEFTFANNTRDCQQLTNFSQWQLKHLVCLVPGRPGPQDFWTYWRTAQSTVFISADQCLDSEDQFNPLSRDFPSWGRYWHV